MSLSFIAYRSRAVDHFTLDELTPLLKQSRSNNLQSSITGLLLFKDRVFFQYIEGGEGPLEELYSRIEKDDRHHSIYLIEKGKLVKRMFPDWSMGYERLQKSYVASNPQVNMFFVSNLKGEKTWHDVVVKSFGGFEDRA